jgi:hypothetical protein
MKKEIGVKTCKFHSKNKKIVKNIIAFERIIFYNLNLLNQVEFNSKGITRIAHHYLRFRCVIE